MKINVRYVVVLFFIQGMNCYSQENKSSINKSDYRKDINRYPNNSIKQIATYYKTLKLSDSSFYENKSLERAVLYNTGKEYKEITYYRNGSIAKEEYGEFIKRVLTIKYDSITHKPIMFYNNDILIQDPDNPGTKQVITRLIPIDSAEIKKKK